jgi:pimeloyl-ACP methyl ester carboxylesterase
LSAHPTAPKLKRAYADGPNGQVHYYDSLGDGPPLLFIHQSPTSSMDYSATFPLFVKAGVRVIAMDTPGMGLSDAPSSEPTIADYAAAAPAVLDHAGVRQADAIGHHTGAQIAV